MTYEQVLNDALSRVDDKYSKRQDSPIFNGVAPSCYEISKIYDLMQEHLKQSFGVTATGIYLENLAKEIGLERFKATYSTKKAEFKNSDASYIDVPIGSRFAKDEYSFVVTKKLDTGIFEIKAEQQGSITNTISGDITAIDNLAVDVSSAKIISTIQQAVDIETDEQLRYRYLQKVREPATSGNIYHYRRWAMEVENVAGAKIFPLWNGNGTVKVMIVNSNMQVADEGLLQKVLSHIELLRPIGATVTVVSAKTKDIEVNAQVISTLNPNKEIINREFKDKLNEYIKEIMLEHFNNTKIEPYFISLAQIGKRLLDTKNVLDYKELKINNLTSNIELTAEEIPNIKQITLSFI